jgi:hypothetical protein
MTMNSITKEELASLLKQAEKAHAEYEKFLGTKDDDWPTWYADFILKKLTRKDEIPPSELLAPSTEALKAKPQQPGETPAPAPVSTLEKSKTDRLGQDEGTEKADTNKTGASQLCPTCAHLNRPGVLFCENCGTNLTTGQQTSLGTRDLREGESEGKDDPHTSLVTALDPKQANAIQSAGTATFSTSMTLRIEIEGGATPILLKPQAQDMILGRRDPTTGATPEVDLTPYAGYRMGVSRKHASLRLENNELNLWDLGSSNGTFLNGTRLSPHRPYLVRDGDEVRLGQMVMRMFFQIVPKSQD